MSKTDKDRPYWVKVRDTIDGSYIDHDHRHGECVAEKFDDRLRWNDWRHHYAKCKKREVIEYFCTKTDPHYYSWGLRSQTCWKYTWTRNDMDLGYSRVYTKCVGHRKVVIHDEIPCSCDDKPETPTCEFRLPDSAHPWHTNSKIRKSTRDNDNGRRRSHYRRVLDQARGEYNAHDDDEFEFDTAPENPRRFYWI